MLGWRLISAAVLVTAVLGLLWLDYQFPLRGASGAWLLPLAVALALLAVAEMMALLRSQGLHPAGWSVYAGTLLVLLAAWAPMFWQLAGATYPPDCPLGALGWPLVAMALSIVLVFLAEMFRYHKPGSTVIHLSLAIFIIAYTGLLLGFLVHLRLLDNHARGLAALVSLVLVVKMSDVGAYFCGRWLGRHKLAARLSPGKTIEGVMGGIAAACLTSWLFFTWMVPLLAPTQAATAAPWGWLSYGALLAIAGVVGDLAESLLKRDLGSKDSGRLIPGMGGVLDVLDSLLVAAPVAYLFWIAGIV